MTNTKTLEEKLAEVRRQHYIDEFFDMEPTNILQAALDAERLRWVEGNKIILMDNYHLRKFDYILEVEDGSTEE